MAAIKSLKLISTITFIILCACRKQSDPVIENSTTITHLNIKDITLKINQGMWFFDADYSSFPDSLYYEPGKYFDWIVTPNTGCDSLVHNFFNPEDGAGSIIAMFHCSGNYQLSANIYDSITKELIGTTDTANITVSSDTLFETQPIQPNDVLNITPEYVSSSPFNSDSLDIAFQIQTTQIYKFTQPTIINYTYKLEGDNCTYSFSNLWLTSYPMLYYPETTNKVWTSIGIPFYTDSVRYINFIWLGKKYSGIIEKTGRKFIFHWDYNDGVIISPKELSF